MRLLLTGATSQLGVALRARLHGLGVEAVALSRRPQPEMPGVRWLCGDMPATLEGQAPFDGIVSFAPMQGLAQWLAVQRDAPAPCLVAMSSMSAVTKREALLAADRDTAAALVAGEEALQRECDRLGMRWTVLRPTMIYGVSLDRNLTPIARRARHWHVLPYPLSNALRQPVHAVDVADAAWRALHTPAAHARVIECGGGERITVTEMFRRLRKSLGTPVIGLPLPLGAARMSAPLLPTLRGPLSRLDTDLVAGNRVLQSVLALTPRGFAPTPATWGFA